MSLKLHLFVSDVNQVNEEGAGGADSRFSCMTAGMERFLLDLLGAYNN